MHAATTTVTVITTGVTIHSYANSIRDLVRQFPDKMRVLMTCATIITLKGRKIIQMMRTSRANGDLRAAAHARRAARE